MAAGEGTRLRPLTESWPKPILPIDGRPVVATLLRELRAASCARVHMVVGHLAEQVEALVGDGRGFGLDVVYVAQPRADGSADAVIRALAAGARPPVLVTAADTVFTSGDVRRFAEAAAGADGAIAYRLDPPPAPPHRAALALADGRVVRVVDADPTNPRAAAPLWWLETRVAEYVDYSLPGPPYELARAYQQAIDAGLEIRGVQIGKTRDLTRPVDLVQENFSYLAGS